jgi:AraC-like DNA-binding protein
MFRIVRHRRTWAAPDLLAGVGAGRSPLTLEGMTEPTAEEVHARPAPLLRPYVTSYVGFRLSGFPAGVHLGTPSRSLTTVISLDDPLEVGYPVGPGARFERFASVSGGLMTRSVAIHHDGRQHGLMLSLTPLGARAVYGMPAAELADTLVSLDDLLGPVGSELLDRLRTAATWADRFAALDTMLARVVARGPGSGRAAPADVRPEVAETWRRLVSARGRIQVGAIAADLGWSRRHLAERFRIEVGLAPKTIARIIRFENAHRLATVDDPPSWADLSTLTGYADQSHLVRDWRAFTGRTPTAWRRGEVLLGT